jgi:hypothetical protein
MKGLKIVRNVLLVIIVLELIMLAQTTIPTGSSLTFINGSSSCDTPAVGKTVICGTTTGVMISANGAPFVSVAGAPGPAGIQGPQGIPGTAGTVNFNGKTCTATFDGMTQDGKGSGTLILHLVVCQ